MSYKKLLIRISIIIYHAATISYSKDIFVQKIRLLSTIILIKFILSIAISIFKKLKRMFKINLNLKHKSKL